MNNSLFVISGASGTGKTSLIRSLLADPRGALLSTSFTTRPPRGNELQGKDYHFVSEENFRKMIQGGEFLEWACVHGNFYGTSAKQLEQLRKNHDVILEIDCQGAQQIRKKEKDIITVFVLPPCWETLKNRLKQRGTDSDEIIHQRLVNAKAEMLQVSLFDYVIINDNFDQALSDLRAIISSGRLRFSQQAQTVEAILGDMVL